MAFLFGDGSGRHEARAADGRVRFPERCAGKSIALYRGLAVEYSSLDRRSARAVKSAAMRP
jgi:hypothetical protein